MINWKSIIIGFIIAIILSIFLGSVGGAIGFSLSMLIAGIAVGYMVDVNMKNGAIHGTITGVITGIILTVLSVIVALAYGAGGMLGLSAVAEFILSIIIFTVLGLIGGIIGTILTERLWQTVFTRGIMAGTAKTESPKETKPKIEFTRENITKCLCPQCPVQAESECAQIKMKMLQESMRGMSPEPSEVPGVYCATGTAACSDLDPNKRCNCPNCNVFKDNKLAQGEPGEHFCQKGSAK
ncbi:DUF5518 domain-containing protein [Methanobacterium sp.]|uniref:DUF5518 domain-containing protein n=1 Tax=Methanobacterium sp. TaxID=2164 RepID=UPI003C768115